MKQISEVNKQLREKKKERDELRRSVIETFKQTFRETLTYLLERDLEGFDYDNFMFLREPETFSTAERYAVAYSFAYATAITLEKHGFKIPYMIVELVPKLGRMYGRVVDHIEKSEVPVFAFSSSREIPAKEIAETVKEENKVLA